MIVGGIAAFGLGIWLGLGRFEQSPREIEEALGEKGERPRAKRHFMYLDYLRPKRRESRRRGRERGRFHVEAPDDERKR